MESLLPADKGDEGKEGDSNPLLAIDVTARPMLDEAALERLGIPTSSTDPNDFIFKKVSDNGANMKAAWTVEDDQWVPCYDHTLELCTLPFTWVEKRKGQEVAAPKGSIAESYSKARGVIGYLHHSTIGEYDFHVCQKKVGLEETKMDQDVKTRWRSSHSMGNQVVYNKPAILEMDKVHKEPGEAWGKNKLTFLDYDHLEEGTACLSHAAKISQLMEGDEYPTSPLVIPMSYRLMQKSAASADVYFANRAADEGNVEEITPVMVKDADLQTKIREARASYHQRLVDRFDSDVALDVKQFWFISTILDPRFKKFEFAGNDMLNASRRRDAFKWFVAAYDKNFKHKAYNPADAPTPQEQATPTEARSSAVPHAKRRTVSSASIFEEDSPGPTDASPAPEPKTQPHEDEVKAYLALPQIPNKNEWSGLEWWEENEKYFPNLAVMARQYLGCPATSATVERLFSAVGIFFSKKRRNTKAETLQNLTFAKMNVE